MKIKEAIVSADRLSRIVAEPAPQPYRRVPAYLIRRLQMISTAIIAEAFEDEDMPVSQWAVLTILESHPEIDQSRLAEVVGIDKTNTGRLVDQLEAKGLVERRPNDSDRRVWMLRCTPLGLKPFPRLHAAPWQPHQLISGTSRWRSTGYKLMRLPRCSMQAGKRLQS